MFLHLPPPPLYPPPLWSHPLLGHRSPPPWLQQVLNYSTRGCALCPNRRGSLSLLTYPSKPRAFAQEGVRPISPAWRARSEGIKSHKDALQGWVSRVNALSLFLKFCTNKQTIKPNKPYGLGQRETEAMVCLLLFPFIPLSMWMTTNHSSNLHPEQGYYPLH